MPTEERVGVKATRERKIGSWVPILMCLLLAGTVWFVFQQNEAETRADQLFAALQSANPAAVKAALDSGADPNSVRAGEIAPAGSVRAGGTAPIGFAGHVREWFAQFMHPDHEMSALTFALQLQQTQSARLLLDRGADAKRRDSFGGTPLVSVSEESWEHTQQQTQIMQILLDKGADINAKDQQGDTALTRSLGGGHDILLDDLTVPRFLLAHGAKVDAKFHDGNTPLQEMIFPSTAYEEKRHIPIITLLLDNSANLNVTDRLGMTPLQSASEQFNPALVQILLNHGANPNGASPSGRTPLVNAINQGQTGIVKLLLAKGADVNDKGQGASMALTSAVLKNSVPMVRLLLAHGANPNLPNYQGYTPLKLATERGYADLIPLLRPYSHKAIN